MKLLTYSRDYREGREHYHIEGINAPIPAAMSLEDLSREDLLVVSHPGWRRCSLNDDANSNVEHYCELVWNNLADCDFVKKMDAKQKSFLRNQLYKPAFTDLGKFSYFMDELKAENAVDFAVSNDIPFILTIPCEKTTEEGRYLPRQGGGLVNYTNNLLSMSRRSFVFPTHPSHGYFIEEDFESKIDLKNPEKAGKILGPALTHPWKNIYFGGGCIAQCLKHTLMYFTKVDNIKIIDDFCFNSEQTLERPDSMDNILRRLVPSLLSARHASKARRRMFSIMRGLSPVRERIADYQELCRMFHEMCLGKPGQIRVQAEANIIQKPIALPEHFNGEYSGV